MGNFSRGIKSVKITSSSILRSTVLFLYMSYEIPFLPVITSLRLLFVFLERREKASIRPTIFFLGLKPPT